MADADAVRGAGLPERLPVGTPDGPTAPTVPAPVAMPQAPGDDETDPTP